MQEVVLTLNKHINWSPRRPINTMENELETNVSETENIDSQNDEVVEEDQDNSPTLEDYLDLKKKNEMLYERAKKAEALAKAKKEAPINKTNNSQSGLSREEAILYAKGYTDEEVTLANKLAKVEGVSPLVAVEDSYFKAKVNERLNKEKADKASLPASNGSTFFKADKPIGDMTDEEHRAHYNKVMGL